MRVLSRLKLRTKLALLLGLSALGVIASIGLAASQMQQRMLSDRIGTLRAATQMSIGFAKSLEQRVAAGELTHQAAIAHLAKVLHVMHFDDGTGDDGSGYVVFQARDGLVLAHGGNPSQEGKLAGGRDANGRSTSDLAWAAVQGGADGVIFYSYPRPGQTLPQPKVAYVARFAPWQVVAFASAYTDDLDADFRATLWRLATIGGLILLVTLLAAWLINRDITRSLGGLRAAMERLASGDLAAEISGADRRDEVGDMAGAVVVFREHMVAEVAAQQEVLRARDAAETANLAKSAFLATMSHEIRTPMNAVLGLAGSLLDGLLTPAQREVVNAIRDSGDSLLRILNDILDFSKLNAGQMTLEAAPFSPTTLTQNAVSILGPRAREKGLAIVAEADPGLPAGLLGDAGRIRQVLLNLVSNSVKFTDAGSVTIGARCIAREGGAATVEWVVRDTGIGIAPNRIGSLFREFVQADSSINRRFGGSGLGLVISKRLVEQMGGSIGVESAVGAGTTFRVRLTLPITEAPPEVQAAPAGEARALEAWSAALGRPLRILFAEDNPTNQFVARQLLKGVAVQVDFVGDGVEAVDAASRFTYDVIFMDMRMPEMDGPAATRLIRQRGGALACVPIIALTANAFPEDVKACFDAGMNQFVTKPVSKDVLIAAILRGLLPPMPPAVPAPDAGRAEAPPPFDAAALRALGEEIGHDGVAEMLDVFQQETRARLQHMATPGIPSDVLMREAHTLKGAAGTVCAPLLRQRAEVIEARLRSGATREPGDLAGLTAALQAFTEALEATGITSQVAA
jgi:signal transduction histidine kinase/HPt (histidine-containing phosphotransfer) domain-containing protein/ActR/RegA family two-component response regulator